MNNLSLIDDVNWLVFSSQLKTAHARTLTSDIERMVELRFHSESYIEHWFSGIILVSKSQIASELISSDFSFHGRNGRRIIKHGKSQFLTKPLRDRERLQLLREGVYWDPQEKRIAAQRLAFQGIETGGKITIQKDILMRFLEFKKLLPLRVFSCNRFSERPLEEFDFTGLPQEIASENSRFSTYISECRHSQRPRMKTVSTLIGKYFPIID